MLSEEEKAKLANRLRRIAGQVSAVQRMMDEDAYCVEILTQIAAASGALGKVGQIILESHIKSCVTDAFENGDPQQRNQSIEELIALFRKFGRVDG